MVTNAHDKGLKVVLDAVFNHVSRDFEQFKDVIKYGKNQNTSIGLS